MSDELKACPFCGETHEWETGTDFHWGKGEFIICRHRALLSAYSPREKQYAETVIWQSRPIEDALRGEVERLTAENMNYAVNVCPEQDRIIAKLKAAVVAFLEFCDVPACDPEGPHNPDYGKYIFDLFGKAENLAREATAAEDFQP